MGKKILSILLLSVMLLTLLPPVTLADSIKLPFSSYVVITEDLSEPYSRRTILYCQGASADGSYYVIETAEDLMLLRDIVNGVAAPIKVLRASSGQTDYPLSDVSALTQNARLVSDITLSGEWTPIGTITTPYSGIFEGSHLSISGLCGMHRHREERYFGLFYKLENATVQNLKVSGVMVFGNGLNGLGESYDIGAIAVIAKDSRILNCECSLVPQIEGRITGTDRRVGGVVGSIQGATTVDRCVNRANIIGNYSIGGIVGFIDKNSPLAIVSNCQNEGNVISRSGDDHGGIVGECLSGRLINCYNRGDVQPDNDSSDTENGGIAGISAISVTSCFNVAKISGSFYVGGIVGKTSNEAVSLTYCMNSGDVSATKEDVQKNFYFAGGLVGSAINISGIPIYIRVDNTNYSSGTVKGGTNVATKLIGAVPNRDFSFSYIPTTDPIIGTLIGLCDDNVAITPAIKANTKLPSEDLQDNDAWLNTLSDTERAKYVRMTLANGLEFPVDIEAVGFPEIFYGDQDKRVTAAVQGISPDSITGYQWYINTDAHNEGGTLIPGATEKTYLIPTPINATDLFYYCTVVVNGKTLRSTVLPIKVSWKLNDWVTEPGLKNSIVGHVEPQGTALYGKTQFTYSKTEDGVFKTKLPSAAGTWYMRASVARSSEYDGLEKTVMVTVTRIPSTGDTAVPLLWLGLALLSCAALTLSLVQLFRKKKSRPE